MDKAIMKTSWGKPVHVISFIRTLLIVLAVAVCTVAAEDVRTLRKKAEQGLAFAQSNLGVMYEKGAALAEDDAKAFKWYRKPAEQGHAQAQFNLGFMYYKGNGVPEDSVAAYAWWSVAAAYGNDMARKNRDITKGRLTPSQLDRGQVMAREISKRMEKRKAAKEE